MDARAGFIVISVWSISFANGQRFCTIASKGVYSGLNDVKRYYKIPNEICSVAVALKQDPQPCSPSKTIKGVAVTSCDWVTKPTIAIRPNLSDVIIIRQGICTDVAPIAVNIMCEEIISDVPVKFLGQGPKVLMPLSYFSQKDINSKGKQTTIATMRVQEGLWRRRRK